MRQFVTDNDISNYKVTLNNISHTFYSADSKPTEVLRNIDLNVNEHEFMAIVGPSGCGKSTLLNIMSKLINPTTGEVKIDGIPLRKISEKIGYVFQSNTLHGSEYNSV